MKININNNDSITINISDNDIKKINKTIFLGKKLFEKDLSRIIKDENQSIKTYNPNKNKIIILKHQELVTNIIKYVLDKYKEELNQLEIVFLACSFGRQTNKIESDLDLHFIYKTNNYRFEYEEIVCYIITMILRKNRDDIDPKLIINFNLNTKKEIESHMTNNDLEIILNTDKEQIKYKYLFNKKKKFFLQYNNSKTIKDLEKYILNNGIKEYNMPWAHSYQVIKGKDIFEKLYLKIYNKEKSILNNKYLNKQKELLINEINLIELNANEKNIAKIKKNYQSKVFTALYKYLNIIRLFYIKNGYEIKYLQIYKLYEIVDNQYKMIIDDILLYIWEIKKLAKYCNLNKINYSIHKDTMIKEYDLNNLKVLFLEIKEKILTSLKEME